MIDGWIEDCSTRTVLKDAVEIKVNQIITYIQSVDSKSGNNEVLTKIEAKELEQMQNLPVQEPTG